LKACKAGRKICLVSVGRQSCQPDFGRIREEKLENTESFMWPTIALIGLMLFLLALVYLWKETPTTPWVTFEKLHEFFEKHDLPRWLLLPLVIVSFAFRPQGKTFLLSSLGFAGFGAIAAIWGSGILDFFLDLIRFFYGQPSGESRQ
jgi:hypothetical protein